MEFFCRFVACHSIVRVRERHRFPCSFHVLGRVLVGGKWSHKGCGCTLSYGFCGNSSRSYGFCGNSSYSDLLLGCPWRLVEINLGWLVLCLVL